MLVFLGVTIGGLVVAMYLPIFKMAGAISEKGQPVVAASRRRPGSARHGPLGSRRPIFPGFIPNRPYEP
jgi:hypothetical protein